MIYFSKFKDFFFNLCQWEVVDNFPRIFSEGMNTLIGYDLVPEPKIVESALRACRRLNDLASAVRILEAVKVSYYTISQD